jgi:hypothetical protein
VENFEILIRPAADIASATLDSDALSQKNIFADISRRAKLSETESTRKKHKQLPIVPARATAAVVET